MNENNLYTSHDLAIAIKSRAKHQNVVIKDMLVSCNIGSNTMSALYHGKSIAFDSLAKIADYLECSVDYLLGRCDTPQIQNSELDDTESEVIKNLRSLNNEGKENILDYSNYIVDSGRYKTEIASEFSPTAKLVAYGGKNIAPTRKKPKGTF